MYYDNISYSINTAENGFIIGLSYSEKNEDGSPRDVYSFKSKQLIMKDWDEVVNWIKENNIDEIFPKVEEEENTSSK